VPSVDPPLSHYFAAEVWRPVVGYEGLYEVSCLGRVRSLHSIKLSRGRLLKPSAHNTGYTRVTLTRPPRQQRPTHIHTLVLEAFAGLRPAGMQAAHLNGCRTDNRIENLAWVTVRENILHKRVHGTAMLGERNHQAKLTENAVREIRTLYASGLSCKAIAARFGVDWTVVRNIKNGRIWTHVV